jgi:hypothetical protein
VTKGHQPKSLNGKLDEDGKLIGTAHANTLLDKSFYVVLFVDGEVEYYSAHTIAENIFEQLDDEGNLFSLLDKIMDHKRNNEAVHKDDAFVIVNGKEQPRRTTKGLKMCVR